MEDFAEYSSEVVEFPSTWKIEKSKRLVDTSCCTDPLPSKANQASQTNFKINVETQTENEFQKQLNTPVDEKKLGIFLKRILPLIETELSEGITPIFGRQSYNVQDSSFTIIPYQKLNIGNSEYIQGTATWLSVRTNNVPILVLSSFPTHTNWCEHIDQYIKIYIPKRIALKNYIEFIELKSIPVKSCIRSLSTNPFNKDIFVGGTISGDLYIWKYIFDNNLGDVEQISCEMTQYGSITSLDWLSEIDLLVTQSDGIITLWKIHKEIILSQKYKLRSLKNSTEVNLSIILAISNTNFIVGTKEGELFLCTISNVTQKNKNYNNPVTLELESHKFQVTSLQKVKIDEIDVLMSCDLSGEVYFHDIRNFEEGPTLIVKMPLPFKNCIVSSLDANFILSPSYDGSLDVFKVNNGIHFIVDGSLRGKGSFIKMSNNGAWVVSGIYEGSFQLFEIKR